MVKKLEIEHFRKYDLPGVVVFTPHALTQDGKGMALEGLMDVCDDQLFYCDCQ